MSYPWTRVPAGEPPLDGFQLRLLPLADFTMALMWSRPGGLSLRTTWLTPATLALSSASSLVALAAGLGALIVGIGRGSMLLWAAAVGCGALAAASGSIALYGIRQRLLSRVGKPGRH